MATAKTTTKRSASTVGAAPAASDAEATGGAPRVLLLTGADGARKSAEARRLLLAHVDADFADFDSETLDGNTATADRVLAAASLAPFGSGGRAVWVRDTQQMDAEEQRRVAGGLDKIAASGLLILHTGAPIYEEGKVKRASVVGTELAAAAKKWGKALDFPLPRAEDARGWVQSIAKNLGKSLTADALSLLSQLPSEDLPRMETEITKAAAHAGDAPSISAADLEATLSRSPDDVIFKLCDAVGSRRASEAMGHVSTLFKSGGRPDAIAPRALVLLARQFRLLAQFRYLADQRLTGGNLPPETAALLPSDGAASILANPRMQWMSKKYVDQARRFSGGELAHRLELLLQVDLALKGIVPGGDSPKALMQRLIAELC